MKTIKAQFNGFCRECEGKIEAGTMIRWFGRFHSKHVDCPTVVEAYETVGYTIDAETLIAAAAKREANEANEPF